jgi:FtsP/CotA-like multicopper oxidase with cupredoxin domain
LRSQPRHIAMLGLIASAAFVTAPHRTPPAVRPNPNTERAGVVRNGVLAVALEAKLSLWHLNGPARSPMTVAALAEPGKGPLMPGPLLRVPAGTEIRLTLHNALAEPLTFFVPASIHGGPDRITAMDSVVVSPGATGTLATRATVPGNYLYRATTPERASRKLGLTGLLTGGLVVDTTRATNPPRDRVLVIMETPDSAAIACADTARGTPLAECQAGRLVFTINGHSWPNTARIPAIVGDSLHWRVLNASNDVHPMHLHGFYYRVDAFSGPLADPSAVPAPGQMVVTQLMSPFSTMSVTWSPDRPGNWLFHCHFAVHLEPDSISAMPDDPHMRDMVGLVLGVIVAPRPGVQVAGEPIARRHLRLIALGSGADAAQRSMHLPTMRFVLEENGRRVDTRRDFSPQVDLVRGEPVAITVVNHLDRPTSVHWHGIEVEDSYVDGVPGFSGRGKHLTPAIAPGDSFVARFTPPRSGTFLYHAHVDEVAEQAAGLEGALIVRDSATSVAPDEHVFFLKGDGLEPEHPLAINGQPNPDTVVMHAGRPVRLRLINLSTRNPSPMFWLTARSDSVFANTKDTLVARWRPLAKDALDLPAALQTPRLAGQMVSMGETYDFEYTPTKRGLLQLEVRASPPPGIPVPHILLIRVPIRVE